MNNQKPRPPGGVCNPMCSYPLTSEDKAGSKEASVVVAGIAPLAKGCALYLEYPRYGTRLGVAENGTTWFNSDRILLPANNIIYTFRDSRSLESTFRWHGRSEGIVEAVVRKCTVDTELQQTCFDVDILAVRQVSAEGVVTVQFPSW